MRSYHILGFGSIGKLIYTQLINNGQSCTAIAHRQGLSPNFTFVDADAHQQHFSINFSFISESSMIERIIVCCKSYQAQEALNAIKHRINPLTEITLLFNGLGPQQTIASIFPDNKVFAATTTHGALWNKALTTLTHTGLGTLVYGALNKLQGDVETELTSDLKALYSKNVTHVLWQKLIINDVINPLTVKHQCTNGALLKAPMINDVILLAKELETLYKAGLCPVEIDLNIIKNVCKKTASNYSSMYCDYYRGTDQNRKTEIEYISGFILTIAKKNGLVLDFHQSLFDSIEQGLFDG